MLYEKTIKDINQAAGLFMSKGLDIPKNLDYTVAMFDDDKLIGTASLGGDIIQGLAVEEKYEGEGIAARLVTHIINYSIDNGIKTLYVFTLPERKNMFESMGFRSVADAAPYASLLEWGIGGIDEYGKYLAESAEIFQNKESASIVMNCNPFTLGHRYLIERAASENDYVYIIIVEENASVFPFNVRFGLVKKGVEDLSNVAVIRGGRYIVSLLTFPSYFTGEENHAAAHSAIDCEIFLRYYVPRLNIKKRYVGNEPYSKVTAIYNETMKKRLASKGIEIKEIERKEIDNNPVSASRVRSLIARGKLSETKELLPKVTYEFINSDQAREIIEKIKLNA